jgi:predicted GNAT family acetyltransferase
MDVNLDDVTVTNNTAAQQYEAHVGGHVGFLEYARDGSRLVLIHTEVPKPLEGRGLAGKIVKTALDDARAHHLEVIPRCPYVISYLKRHQDYLDLVPPGERHSVQRS